MQIKKTTFYLIFVLFAVFLTLFLIRFYDSPEPREHAYQFPTMSTWSALRFFGNDQECEKARELTVREFDTVNQVANVFDPDSELSKLNAAQPTVEAPFHLSEALTELLVIADRANRESNGAFDITVKPLMELWGFHRRQKTTPTPEAVAEALRAVGWQRVVRFDPEARTIAFTVPGVRLDAGGVAKGWAVDRACRAIDRETGLRCGLVNLGGNIGVLPDPPPGKEAFSIGITDPADPDSTIGTFSLRCGATASSGDYRRFIILDSVKYSHIIDPRTGYPARRLPGVTVVAPDAATADWFSTAASVEPDLPLPPGVGVIEIPEDTAPRLRGPFPPHQLQPAPEQ